MRAAALVLLSYFFFAAPKAGEEHTTERDNDLNLSPSIAQVLREEMREVARDMQTIAAALPLGDWESIHEAGARIQSAYILEQQLNEAQMAELLRLPDEFHRLDATLHARAERLARAAEERDAEAVAFQYSRLLENCVQCHATYAGRRFPELQGDALDASDHHGR